MVKSGRMSQKTYRVFLLIFFTLVSMVRSQLYLAPSPLMGTIMEELNLNYAQGGQLLFVVTVLMGVFLFIGSAVIDRVGSRKTLMLSFVCLGVDGAVALFAPNYVVLMLGRVFTGIGMGLSIAAMPALITEHFSQRTRVYVNSYNNALGAFCMALSYSITVPLYRLLGSWRSILFFWSMLSLAGGALFTVIDGWHKSPAAGKPVRQSKGESSLRQAARMPVVWVLLVATIGALWVFTVYSSYLPTFLVAQRSMSLGQAGALTALIQYGGVAGCLLWGLLGGRIRNPVVFLLSPLLAMLAGAVGSVLFPAGPALSACVLLMGMAYYAYNMAALTTLMKAPGVSAGTIAGGTAIYLGGGSVLAIAAPGVFDLLQRHLGMQIALLCFNLLLAISCLCVYLMRNHCRGGLFRHYNGAANRT